MTDRRKDLLALAILLAILILLFSKILFTGRIVRAPDILNEFYWVALEASKRHFLDLFRFKLFTGWDIYVNSGNTLEGGELGGQFLLLQSLIFYLFPLPTSIAWHMVIHLFLGACGTFLYCRAVGASRVASFLGGLLFAIVPANASLINAGHVLKIATISVAPWAFFLFEKGFQSRRLIFFLATGFVLAFQFFYTHWQIAFYTCLGIGVYGLMRSAGVLMAEGKSAGREVPRLLGLNLVTMFFFLSTVAITLLPLANWSVETNRGAESGANLGKGGLEREEAMSWSMPPEELATFVIPGFFGLSRQEGGENPSNIASYYWGRMNFTQTNDYMGLLPWLLLPLPLIFRRDRYTWLALAGLACAILFSMGKYTVFYQFLFDHFPGVNRFRVPKMMMFVAIMALGVLSARGVDILLDEETRKTRGFRRYIAVLLAFPLLLLLLMGVEVAGKEYWIGTFLEMLAQPTRYEQGPALVMGRWNNLVTETGIAAAVAALYAAAFFACYRKWLPVKLVPLLLLLLFVADVWRINDKFLFLVDAPEHTRNIKTPVMDFLSRDSKEYRVLPINADPNRYASQKIPTMFVSMPVQQRRWQDILDSFSFTSAMPDMLNVKYLVYERDQYAQEKGMLGGKYLPVYQSPDGREIVLENRAVLPKAWLVPSALVLTDVQKTLAILQNPGFDPRRVALVESPPPIPLASPDAAVAGPGQANVTRYEGERIDVTATVSQNALLVLGEKYYRGWKATVDGNAAEIYPVDHVLRGVYLPPGRHGVEFVFDPVPFKIGKYLTLFSFAFFAVMLGRELLTRRKRA